MASTQITVENLTVFPIYALLTWSEKHIGGVVIQTPSPDEDGMSVLDPEGLRSDGTGVVGGYTYAQKQAVKGGTSWIFEPAPLGGYQLRER
jgi:hypothetical protein